MADFKTAKEKNSKMSTENASETAPLRLTADELSIATGSPEKRTAVIDSRAVPVWTFSGKDADQSVAGTISRLPAALIVKPGLAKIEELPLSVTDEGMTVVDRGHGTPMQV